MEPLEQITDLIAERGAALTQDDLNAIKSLSIDVPLDQSEDLAMAMEGIALIVNSPTYKGDIAPMV